MSLQEVQSLISELNAERKLYKGNKQKLLEIKGVINYYNELKRRLEIGQTTLGVNRPVVAV